MSLAILYSRAQEGINSPLVTVEVHLANGLPALSIVGLPEMAVRESKDRVRGALINSQFEFPARRITINLAPADLPKEGGRFDLPIALGILAASGQIPKQALDQYEFAGELALSGQLRRVHGILPAALAARDAKRALILAEDNAAEAALVEGLTCQPADHLLQVCAHLKGLETLPTQQKALVESTPEQPDMADVIGQQQAKRALEISAAGAHSLLYIGPPGTGKSMLAARLPGILPPLTEQEALESAAIRSLAQQQPFDSSCWSQRPFRAPHHTASAVALVGGGSHPKPGEISLAHHGVLFLDELPEYDRHVLEVLREPMENGSITISRANRQADYPARFQLLAAMNPCPCGHLGDGSNRCHCTIEQISRYRNRISGPLLDRIDMHVEVPRQPIPIGGRQSNSREEGSEQIQARILAARRRQYQRQGKTNQALAGRDIETYIQIDGAGQKLLQKAVDQLGLSMRAYHRIIKVARTIADLEASPEILTQHLSEAIGYRRLDRRQEY
ncbi:ATP-dependent protease [Candidatus Thiodiazotropha endoloripes]|uniref:YifB family Mg chelatase-like AAA ATPase n=1 Tax=Candidatus Thiodiazotropha endoloripes TaxID=1818881 RepID=UPI00083D73A1|nr:YifB family Mg chelatase-like AAA ATPase [Candidatus Thiodiazotropha endoloripes]ODB84375.1 ATP-dependent protease [Candidatus Thiodiazotropha endoloripes]ODB91257.1 ATP-dependent protease [Candidatus Thiodiazotropha endoloripes]ODB93402.1 ATP-dependent protease [Candidatus Thiodiazotropha endoloripes]